ncbi:MAG: iron-sulfur cluster-binding protein [Chitinophagaceae bacterium]|nr:iron-sulfur cluster-binding protein [Chitinophagaceae bacterium]MCW5926061.1 iron-sulfur cluster-binding protein [Chitinophagaceae bacterium]
MTTYKQIFIEESRKKGIDPEHRRKINHSLLQSDIAFQKGIPQFSHLQSAKKAANHIKRTAIENLDTYLLRFEKHFTQNGGKVIWAATAQEALDAVDRICKEVNARLVVKSKSMVTEEIHLNPFLSSKGIEVVETDLGEYIQQLAGEPPYHLVAPSMHKSKEEVADLFHEKLGASKGLAPEALTQFARKILREKYVQADIGITGVNFLLADIGGVALTENEGNGRLSTSFPKVHIAVTGIEKILPSVRDLGLFWPLLATHGSGQQITVYNSIFTGPRKTGEKDGPEKMYVILLDNGRTRLLADPKARESLYCIRCGACLNVCPVFRNIGGHTYNSTYGGPIGSVITPHLKGMQQYAHLSQASSLCGACTEVCPVGIPIHELLLYNRQLSAKNATRLEKLGWRIWANACSNRSLMNMNGGKIKNKVIRILFSGAWGANRDLPKFASQSFNQLWRKQRQ